VSRFGCATALTLAALAQNAIFGVLASDVVTRKAVVAAAAFMLPEGCRRLARWLEDWGSTATMSFRSPGCFPQRVLLSKPIPQDWSTS
jgi:hypothetical protein